MISYNNKKYNVNNYEKNKEFINTYNIKCNCGCKGSCIKYGNYNRKYIKNGVKKSLYIQRIYCKSCKRTQAILPSDIVPYRLLTIDEIIDIIEVYEENAKIIDPNDNKIIKRYKIWKERLKTVLIDFKRDEIEKIISFCASKYRMCFMQVKRKRYRSMCKIYEATYSII